jgi:hypothetical protein
LLAQAAAVEALFPVHRVRALMVVAMVVLLVVALVLWVLQILAAVVVLREVI